MNAETLMKPAAETACVDSCEEERCLQRVRAT